MSPPEDDFESYLYAAILVAERAAKTGEDVSSAINELGDMADKSSKSIPPTEDSSGITKLPKPE